eukprot:4461772-Pyramimonas_sp.AAC.1
MRPSRRPRTTSSQACGCASSRFSPRMQGSTSTATPSPTYNVGKMIKNVSRIGFETRLRAWKGRLHWLRHR